MRTSLLVGTALAVTAALVVLVSGGLGLDLEPIALLGLAIGFVITRVQDRTPGLRVAAVLSGIFVALVGYAVRAAVLPDSPGGRAVAVALVIGLATVLAAGSRERLPFWAVLLGAGTLAGAYERVYTVAPPEMVSTSMLTLSALLVAMAAGHLTGTLTAPRPVATATPAPASDDLNVELDALLESERTAATRTDDTVMENAR